MATARAPWRIVIADDDPEVRAVLRRVFELGGEFKVREATSADSAVEVALSWDADATLIDWEMTGSNGPTVLRRLKRAQYDGVAVMLSAADAAAGELGALGAGADDYLEKGSDPRLISETVRRLLVEADPSTRPVAAAC